MSVSKKAGIDFKLFVSLNNHKKVQPRFLKQFKYLNQTLFRVFQREFAANSIITALYLCHLKLINNLNKCY